MLADKTFFQIQFGPVEYCLSWGVSYLLKQCEISLFHAISFHFLKLETSTRVEAQLRSHVTRIIRERCSNCTMFSELFLRRGFFVCHGNPTTATYRSVLVNPFPSVPTHALYMMNIIENWILTAPSLRLDWLLVRVNPNCPAAISNLDDAECASEDRFIPDPEISNEISRVLNACAVRQLGGAICPVW